MRPVLRLQARLELLLVAALLATTACGVLIVDDAPPPDMARALDMAVPAPDLVVLADLTVPADLTALPDLTVPDDLTMPPDLAPACVGVTPDKAAYGRMPGPWRFPLDGGGLPDGGGNGPLPQPGDPTATFQLTDFQPRSCGFGATYGLELFRGRPLVVSLWAGW